MARYLGQALWVVEKGIHRLDKYAGFAAGLLVQKVARGEVSFNGHPDHRFMARAVAETLIGPPAAPQPYLQYALWFRRCVDDIHGVLYEAQERVVIEHPVDAPPRVYLFILTAGMVYNSETGREELAVLWIDVLRQWPPERPCRIIDTF